MTMEKGKSLIIWFKSGATGKFEQVENFKSNVNDNGTSAIYFDYFGVSTQVKREAVFLLSNIAGFALEV